MLLSAERARDRRAALREGALFGLLYSAVLLGWSRLLGWHVVLFALLLGSAFGALFAEAVRLSARLPAWARPLAAGLAWVLPVLAADIPARPFFGSIVLLTGLHAPLPAPWLQLARPFGETGLLFLLIAFNGLLARILVEKKRLPYAAAAAAGLVLSGAWGAARVKAIAGAPRGEGNFVLACAQHDLPFPWSWRAQHGAELFKTYESMALEAAGKGANMVLFPQYQLPEDVYREPGRWSDIARKSKAFVALGTDVPVKPHVFGKESWVIGIVFGPDGKVYDTQVAQHPSPVGRPMTIPGAESRPIPIPGLGKVAILPCFDDVSARPVRRAEKAGADMLLSIANDGMFQGTNHPRLHLHRARLRAVESGKWLVRCIPNEGSSVIDPSGAVREALPAGKGLLISRW